MKYGKGKPLSLQQVLYKNIYALCQETYKTCVCYVKRDLKYIYKKNKKHTKIWIYIFIFHQSVCRSATAKMEMANLALEPRDCKNIIHKDGCEEWINKRKQMAYRAFRRIENRGRGLRESVYAAGFHDKVGPENGSASERRRGHGAESAGWFPSWPVKQPSPLPLSNGLCLTPWPFLTLSLCPRGKDASPWKPWTAENKARKERERKRRRRRGRSAVANLLIRIL